MWYVSRNSLLHFAALFLCRFFFVLGTKIEKICNRFFTWYFPFQSVSPICSGSCFFKLPLSFYLLFITSDYGKAVNYITTSTTAKETKGRDFKSIGGDKQSDSYLQGNLICVTESWIIRKLNCSTLKVVQDGAVRNMFGNVSIDLLCVLWNRCNCAGVLLFCDGHWCWVKIIRTVICDMELSFSAVFLPYSRLSGNLLTKNYTRILAY